jgi:ADP-ribosylglycohydrolase
MTNNLSDYQKEVFMDIYKTSLGAMLSTYQNPDGISINSAISDSTKIALASIELLTDGNSLRKPSEIINALNERRSDEPLEFPVIEV